MALILVALTALFGVVLVEGVPRLDLAFFVEAPDADMTGGGIGPALVGTALVTLLMTVAGVPVGVATGIWLAEYAPRAGAWGPRLAAVVRGAVANLAGVPSIVFGLFGLGFFVLFVGGQLDALLHGPDAPPIWAQPGLLWAGPTLSVLTLPVVIVTTEEALRAVPGPLREAALGVGATRFQTTFRIVLPRAASGIWTGVALAVGRGAGEVAPILFTAAANYLPSLPNDPRDMFMHLGYHVYALATQSPNVDAARPTLFATALVLLSLSFALSSVAMVLRARARSAT
ncbi:MAG: phosphate ABC transporter permease PstA [Myxococcales bacterium]|nr:phosphate ABC transporter permease PstA [Myxococcales bacterium]